MSAMRRCRAAAPHGPGASADVRGPCRTVVAVAGALLLGACASDTARKPKGTVPPDFALSPTGFDKLPGWRHGRQAGALAAFSRSCRRLGALVSDRPATLGPARARAGRVRHWRRACTALRSVAPTGDAAARAFFEAHFSPYIVHGSKGKTGLITGYYEAEIRASRKRTSTYRVPIYAPPPELVTVNLGRFSRRWNGLRVRGRVDKGRLVPFYTRAEVEAGRVSVSWPVVLWADDPVDVFVTHIQGSARVLLPNGALTRIGYAADNGAAFAGIGRNMLKRRLIGPGQASMQGIRAWLKANPGRAGRIMQENPRFIFFREVKGAGPIGASGVVLSPGRSLAVDPAFIPYGAPVWLDTNWPGRKDRPLRRLMVAQDSGNAIKGAVRGDFFWGSGERALAQAGRMKETGSFYLLLPRAVREPR